MTAGKCSSRGGITYITYDETEISGMAGCKTSITLNGDHLKMTRKGAVGTMDTIMEFEEGKRYEGVYPTPYGNIGMELLTNQIHFEKKEEGPQKISVDYSLTLKGIVESHNQIEIEVLS